MSSNHSVDTNTSLPKKNGHVVHGGSKTKKSNQKHSKSHSKSHQKSKKSKKVKMPKGYAYCMNPKCRKQVKMVNEKTKTTKNGRSLLYGEGSCGHQVFRFA